MITTEYDALSRMGIDDPKGYIEKRYACSGKVTPLVTCAVGEVVITEVEAAVEEAQSSGSWVDIMVGNVTVVNVTYVNKKKFVYKTGSMHLIGRLKASSAE